MKNSVEDKMVAYMNDKYDDKFTYLAPFGGGIGAKTKQITVKSEKFPDYKIWVEYYQENNEDVFRDNYVQYKYKKELTEKLTDMLETVFERKVKVTNSVSSVGGAQDFSNETTFDEYKGSASSNICFIAVVSNGCKITDSESIENKVHQVFNEQNVVGYGDIYFSDSSANFKYFNELNTETRNSLTRFSFEIDENGNFLSDNWR